MDWATHVLAGFALARATLKRLTPLAILIAALGAVASYFVLGALRFHHDLIAPGDPWIAVILSIAVIAPFLSRLVSSEIGARPSPGRGAAIFALVLVVLYLGLRQQLHARAAETLQSRLYDGLSPKRVAALPGPFNPLAWRGLVDTGAYTREVPVQLFQEFDPDAGQTFYPPESSPAIEAVKKTTRYQQASSHLSWPRWEVIPFDNYTQVRVTDLRSGLTTSFEVDRSGRVLKD